MSSGISRGSSIRLASWMLNRLSGRTGPGRGTRSWCPRGSRYEFNEKENRYELEYISLSRYRLLAVSSDGVRWTKPDLGLVEFEGSRANNILEIVPRREQRGSGRPLRGTVGLPDSRGA